MRAMTAAFAATLVIAIAASFALKEAGFSADEQTAGMSVRLD